MSRFLPRLVLLPLLLAFAGCSTVINGSNRGVSIASDPLGAQIFINGQSRGRTPQQINLPRLGTNVIRLELPGYLSYETRVSKAVEGWVFGNLAIGGLLGVAIDAASGAMFEYEPASVYPKLRPRDGRRRLNEDDLSRANEEGATLQVRIVNGSQPGWRKVGQLMARR